MLSCLEHLTLKKCLENISTLQALGQVTEFRRNDMFFQLAGGSLPIIFGPVDFRRRGTPPKEDLLRRKWKERT